MRCAAIPLREAQRTDVDVRDRLLEQLRAEQAHRDAQDRDELWMCIRAAGAAPDQADS